MTLVSEGWEGTAVDSQALGGQGSAPTHTEEQSGTDMAFGQASLGLEFFLHSANRFGTIGKMLFTSLSLSPRLQNGKSTGVLQWAGTGATCA